MTSEMELAKTQMMSVEPPQASQNHDDISSRCSLEKIEEHPLWPLLSRMTIATIAGISLSGFKVGDLLRLKPGELVESDWPHTEDIPVKAGSVQVAWSEFEVADQRLMVRLTRLG